MRSLLRNAVLFFLSSFSILVLEFIISFFLIKKFMGTMKETLFLVGLVTTILGFMSMMQGNPSGTIASNSQQANFVNFEVTRKEREQTNYFKNFKRNSVLSSSFIGLSLVIGGFLAMIVLKIFL